VERKQKDKGKKRGKSINKKGIFVVIFFGAILLTSTVVISIPGLGGVNESEIISKTGTPMDNFPDEQRDTFCGTGEAKSTSFVTEYKIPTPCTQPLAITTTPDGMIWFVESNAGLIANFNPITGFFTEFDNPYLSDGDRSMNWGIDYSPDNSIWYTDGSFDTLWRFSIDDEIYSAVTFPSSESGSLPQRLQIDGSNIFVNDFTGGKITVFDLVQDNEEVSYISIVNPIPEGFTGDFDLDQEGNLWYTTWIPDSTGFLAKFDYPQYTQDVNLFGTSSENYVEVFEFPKDLNTANGLTVDSDGNIWIVDTSSSYFFKFDYQSNEFTKYITNVPHLSTYGNETGVIKNPISRPYWSDFDSYGNLIFNEQTANRIGLFDVSNEILIEYMIPSKNPNWGDCGQLKDCGISQVFDFTIDNKKIWFTEWVENNIGFIDTEKSLPFSIESDKQIAKVKKGESTELILNVKYNSMSDYLDSEFLSAHTASNTINFSDIEISSLRESIQNTNEKIIVKIRASDNSLSGNYKVLVGIGNNEITISKFINVTIES
jgi:virginiamycin B lyase